MKHILIFICSLFTIQTLQADMLAKSITTQEENTVLTLLNNFCGDSWCEGDYDILFNQIQFTPNDEIFILASATPMSANLDVNSDSNSNSDLDNKTNPVSLYCQISEPSIIMDTLTIKDKEQLSEAEQRLYNVVSDCIDTALYSKPI